jgi:hypothetical protein
MPDAKKTGFVFTIDATLALSLLLIILATTVFLSIQAAEDPYGKLQVARTGKDMLAVMDSQGALSSGNNTTIQSAMDSMLPGGLGAHLQVSSYYYSSGSNSFNYINETAEYGENIPENRTTHGARWDFVSLKNGQITNYSIARMWIWQR